MTAVKNDKPDAVKHVVEQVDVMLDPDLIDEALVKAAIDNRAESFKVLMRELQALCLDVATYKLDVSQNTDLNAFEVNLMSENSEDFDPPLLKQNFTTNDNNGKNLNL